MVNVVPFKKGFIGLIPSGPSGSKGGLSGVSGKMSGGCLVDNVWWRGLMNGWLHLNCLRARWLCLDIDVAWKWWRWWLFWALCCVCVCVCVCVLCVCVCVSVCCERYVVLCDKLEVSQSCHLVQSSVHWHLAGDSNGSHRNETIFQMQIKLFKYDIWSDENRGQQLIDFWTYSYFHFLVWNRKRQILSQSFVELDLGWSQQIVISQQIYFVQIFFQWIHCCGTFAIKATLRRWGRPWAGCELFE